MTLELFSHNQLGLLGVYGTCFLLLGLVASFLLKAHSARAHQVLLLSMLGTILMPGLYQTAKGLEWGLLAVEPAPSSAVMPLESASSEVADSVAVSELPITSSTETRLPASNSTPRFSWQSSFAWIWLLLSLALLTRLMMAFMKTRHLVDHAVSVNDSPLQDVLQRACKKLNIPNTAGLFTHEDIQTPSIWCWGKRAMLLLPNQALSDRQTFNWDGIICHEIAHYKRKDHLSAVFGELFVCLLPWNPLSWIVKRRLTLLSERACDDWVLACDQEGVAYAESLLDLLPQVQPAFTPSVATSKRGVTHRVHRILKDQTGNPNIGLRWILGSSVMAALAVVGICLAQARPTQQSAEAVQVSTDRLVQLIAVDPNDLTLDHLADICEAMEAALVNVHVSYEWYVEPAPVLEDVRGSSMIITVGHSKCELLVSLPTEEVRITNSADYVNGNGDAWHQTMASSFDGKISTQLSISDFPIQYSRATIDKGKRFIPPLNATPLGFSILKFQLGDNKQPPLSVRLRQDQALIHLEKGVVCNGFKCVRIDFLQPRVLRRHQSVYFSVDHGYAPVRYEFINGVEVSYTANVKALQPVQKGLWFPSSGVLESKDSPINVYEAQSPIIVNAQISNKDFEIVLPAGTKVNDRVKGKNYMVEPTKAQTERFKKQEGVLPGHADEMAAEDKQGARVHSMGMLSKLSTARDMYFSDHDKTLPQSLEGLEPYLSDDELLWLKRNVTLKAIDLKNKTMDLSKTPLAYDKTLLQKGKGTSVLSVNGIIKYLSEEQFKALGLEP